MGEEGCISYLYYLYFPLYKGMTRFFSSFPYNPYLFI